MGRIYDLRTAQTQCRIRIGELEKEISKLRQAQTGIQVLASYIYTSYQKALYKYDVLDDWRGHRYDEFYSDYAEDYIERLHRYQYDVNELPGEIEQICREKENELQYEQEREQAIGSEIAMLEAEMYV